MPLSVEIRCLPVHLVCDDYGGAYGGSNVATAGEAPAPPWPGIMSEVISLNHRMRPVRKEDHLLSV